MGKKVKFPCRFQNNKFLFRLDQKGMGILVHLALAFKECHEGQKKGIKTS